MINKNTLRTLFVVMVVVASAMFIIADGDKPWSNGFNNGFGLYECSTEDITDMYADYVEEWKKEIKESFDKAQKEVYNNTPIPDDIVGPDPDPKKCICGGSGWIKQGDGHKTKCPYHGAGMSDIIKKNGLIIHRH